MNSLPEPYEALMARLEALERRVSALERPSEKIEEAVVQSPAASAPNALLAPEQAEAFGGFSFPVLGKAMLGIAGAYMLRAVEESGSAPRTSVAVVAIIYALLWLVGAARSSTAGWFPRAAYSCTSALILAPMLWEVTLRFQALPAWASAAALGIFAFAAMALAWRRNLAPVVWVADLGAVAVALSLSIASHQIPVFLAVLLLMVLLAEIAEARERTVSTLPLVALAAAAAVWDEIFIYSRAPDTRTQYPALGAFALIAPGIGLLLIIGAGVIYKTTIKGKKITIFETVLIMIAYLLAACGLLSFGPPARQMLLGVICFVLCAAGYAVAFFVFEQAEDKRNFQVFAGWSAALLVAGSLLCLPTLLTTACLGAAAVAACLTASFRKQHALALHGMVFVVAAAVVSGLFVSLLQALIGSPPGLFNLDVWLAALSAAICYWAARPRQNENWKRQIAPMVFLALTTAAVAAFLVEGAMALVARIATPGAHHLAFVRTLVLCVAALGLAVGGLRWQRKELTRVGYVTLALAAVKLVAEDLRHGHVGFIAASIFFFAVTLIAVPRMARTTARKA